MPKIIIIHGPMAAGKSTITGKLRKKLPDYAYVDRPNLKRGLKPLGRELAKKISKESSYDVMRKVMKLKKNIIAEEISPVSLRKKLKNYLKKYDYKVHAFYLKCSLEEAKKRDNLRQKTSRPRLVRNIHKSYAEPSIYDYVIDTQKLSANQSVKLILKNTRSK